MAPHYRVVRAERCPAGKAGVTGHRHPEAHVLATNTLARLAADLQRWARELGFQAVGVADVDLANAADGHRRWLEAGFHGAMDYMSRNAGKRARPGRLVPGTVRVISARMNYLPAAARPAAAVLGDPERAYISRYALGRDYHKTLRARLVRLAQRMADAVGPFGYRVFTDSAPVFEVELARKAGLGWRGKHTLLLSRDHGSWFFLGEIYTDLPLPLSAPVPAHCGRCRSCIDVCPTGAIVAPYRLDARRCISYLTIELRESIPIELRRPIGNRVYGCDDCQLGCPWNRFAPPGDEADFAVRNGLDDGTLVELFGWTEEAFRTRLAGSAIRRIGYARWLRNLAVGLGNAPHSPAALAALAARRDDPSPLVREHVAWAIAEQLAKRDAAPAQRSS